MSSSPNYLLVKACEIALKEAESKVRESDGKNDSPRIREYLSVCGLKPPEPYCACFVCWCIKEACKFYDVLPPIKFDAFTPTLYSRCQKINSKTHKIQKGDLFFVFNEKLGRIAHVGFVQSELDENGYFDTTEGNTDASQTREGDGVYNARRKNTDKILFARI